jgi:hypothetical protein
MKKSFLIFLLSVLCLDVFEIIVVTLRIFSRENLKESFNKILILSI